MSKQPYAALQISEESKAQLLAVFPPQYGYIALDHITIQYGTEDKAALINPDTIEVLGRADDGKGIEALLVRIDGQSFRDDGNPWHITLSYNKDLPAPLELDPYNDAPLADKKDKRKSRPYTAVMSNKLIRLALNPEMGGYHVEYLQAPLTITATAQINQPEPDLDTSNERDIAPL